MVATNAAKGLLDLIESWKHDVKGTNETVATQRGTSSRLSEELWRNQLSAAGLLLEIETFIDERGEREMYAPLLHELRRFLFIPEQNWLQSAGKFPPSVRLGLHQLGQIIESSAPRTLRLDPTQVQALQHAVGECLEILDPVTATHDHGLQYLREILTQMHQLLEGDDVDFTAVRAAAYQAAGLTVIHGRALPEEKRQRFAERLFSVVVPFSTGTATGATGNVIGAALTNFFQIGS